ncbi:putative motility protein [Zavarzinia sp.]|uniref:putative motility protein n=1 Tax=Zavarzinia sp. TaxID=2027920 RepID=UPI003BB5C8A6
MSDLATLAVTMNSLQTRSEVSLVAVKQNADFQRQVVAELFATMEAMPRPPEGMGQQVDQLA